MNFMRNLVTLRRFVYPQRSVCELWVIALVFSASLQLADDTFAAIITLQQGLSGYTHQDATVRTDGTSANVTNNTTRTLTGSVGAGSPPGPLRAIFSFPMTGVPSNAVVNSATFHIGRDPDTGNSVSGSYTVDLRTISTSFNEVTATWNNTFAAGMTLGGAALSSTTMNPEGALAIHTFSSTPSLVSAVQASLDASLPFNFALVAQAAVETGTSRVIFRLGSNSSNLNLVDPLRPTLDIDYTVVPEPDSAFLLLLVGGWACVVARASRSLNRHSGSSK